MAILIRHWMDQNYMNDYLSQTKRVYREKMFILFMLRRQITHHWLLWTFFSLSLANGLHCLTDCCGLW